MFLWLRLRITAISLLQVLFAYVVRTHKNAMQNVTNSHTIEKWRKES